MSLTGNTTSKTLRGHIKYLRTIRGYSAYEIAVINGFSGTEEEWLKTLEMSPAEVEEAVAKYLNENPVAIDATLSKSGEAADAKATGEALNALNKTMTDTFNNVVGAHVNNKNNPHGVTKAQVGLGNVDNTSDKDKPVSTAQATAIADAKKAGTDAQTAAENAQTSADNAQTAADNAQTAADNAQSTADNAQTAADNAQTAADGKVSKSGDNVTGKLNVASPFAVSGPSYPTYAFRKSFNGEEIGGMSMKVATRQVYFTAFNEDMDGASNRYKECFTLSKPSTGMTSDKWYDILTTKNVAFSSGNGTADATNVENTVTFSYFKYGRIVIVYFALQMTDNPKTSYTNYQVGTGLPKASSVARFPAIQHNLGTGSRYPIVAYVNTSGALMFTSGSSGLGGCEVQGSVVYISES